MAKLVGNEAEQKKLIQMVKRANLRSESDRKKIVLAVKQFSDYEAAFSTFGDNGTHIGEVYMVCAGPEKMVRAGYSKTRKDAMDNYDKAIAYAEKHKNELT
ncbi:hypothetical protein [Shimazuella alba]|uniref:Uncharacterized protein n=1 Tax=Shimazuella alba TaxID=2690964 RepID=A0A6I4VV29_9BACL|nr:hypothetical protein [Shimazuella alba]MXQ52374.1 hypothetical protein [Shimazuella alba]